MTAWSLALLALLSMLPGALAVVGAPTLPEPELPLDPTPPSPAPAPEPQPAAPAPSATPTPAPAPTPGPAPAPASPALPEDAPLVNGTRDEPPAGTSEAPAERTTRQSSGRKVPVPFSLGLAAVAGVALLLRRTRG